MLRCWFRRTPCISDKICYGKNALQNYCTLHNGILRDLRRMYGASGLFYEGTHFASLHTPASLSPLTILGTSLFIKAVSIIPDMLFLTISSSLLILPPFRYVTPNSLIHLLRYCSFCRFLCLIRKSSFEQGVSTV